MKHLVTLLLASSINFAGMQNNSLINTPKSIMYNPKGKVNDFRYMVRMKNVFSNYLLFKEPFKTKNYVREIRFVDGRSKVRSSDAPFFYTNEKLASIEKIAGQILSIDYYTYENNLMSNLKSKHDMEGDSVFDLEMNFTWDENKCQAKAKQFQVDFEYNNDKINKFKMSGSKNSRELIKTDFGFLIKSYREGNLYTIDKYLVDDYDLKEIQTDVNSDGVYDLFYDVKKELLIQPETLTKD